jgi:hypothetical protein
MAIGSETWIKFENQSKAMRILLPFILFFTLQAVYSQGVRIGSNPGTPDSSAILDVDDTTKGFLPPRLTTNQRNSILNPADGLLVFNVSSSKNSLLNK